MRKINLVKLIVFAPVALASLVAASCTLSGVSNDCQVGDLTAGQAGGGGSAPVEAGPRECLCAAPLNFVPECRRMVARVDGGCDDEPLPNFSACRSGVGLCFGGVCAAPNWDAQCVQSPALGPWLLCNDVKDCDDGNPCTSDSCPAPGCEPCLHVPIADLTDCGDNMLCRQGACCDKPSGFNAH